MCWGVRCIQVACSAVPLGTKLMHHHATGWWSNGRVAFLFSWRNCSEGISNILILRFQAVFGEDLWDVGFGYCFSWLVTSNVILVLFGINKGICLEGI